MENNLTLNLHPNELDYIAKCLHRQPYGDVAPLLAKIQSQVIQQQMAEQVAQEQSQQAAIDRDMVDRPQPRKGSPLRAVDGEEPTPSPEAA